MTPSLSRDLNAILRLCQRTVELGEKATAGPWETETIDNDGEYGFGDESTTGFKSYEVTNPKGRSVVDTLNSDEAEIHEEFNDEGKYAWDELGKRNASFIAHTRDFSPASAKAVMEQIKAYNNLGPWSQSDCRPLMQALASQFTPEMLKPYYE